jgi:hypothetical protein
MLNDCVEDAIPLTPSEKCRKQELENVVRGGLATFLTVGAALLEIRRKRLFRVEYPDFPSYVRAEFNLAASSVNGLIQNFQLAQSLADDGITLPPDATSTTFKPLASLPTNEGLRSACWKFAVSISPARAPSGTLMARLTRLSLTWLKVAGVDRF